MRSMQQLCNRPLRTNPVKDQLLQLCHLCLLVNCERHRFAIDVSHENLHIRADLADLLNDAPVDRVVVFVACQRLAVVAAEGAWLAFTQQLHTGSSAQGETQKFVLLIQAIVIVRCPVTPHVLASMFSVLCKGAKQPPIRHATDACNCYKRTCCTALSENVCPHGNTRGCRSPSGANLSSVTWHRGTGCTHD